MSVTVEGLRFRYPAQDADALSGIDLAVREGEITWLTGKLGSGTSTLLLAAAGLAPRMTGGVLTGTVRVAGVDPATRPPLAAGIAYLGPSPSLQLSGIAQTVRDEVAVGPMNLGLPRERILQLTTDALALFDVGHLADRAPGKLSGGETQRVMLAALYATSPHTWLLDEPFSALDHSARRAVARILRGLASNGATVIVASDDADVMLGVADRAVVLDAGSCGIDGSPSDVLAGDAIHASGASSTDAAELARLAGIAAPRPLSADGLLELLDLSARTTIDDATDQPAAVTAPVLQVSDVTFRYSNGRDVLRGADLIVQRGEAAGLFGVNGAGKSTLLRLAMALEHPVAGDVAVLGTGTRGRHPENLAPQVAFLFQQPERQLFATSVRAECRFGAQLAGWDSRRIAAATSTVVHALGLGDVVDEHPGDLPLARRRLVALAALLVTDPALLLLDEPTAGLDNASRRRVIEVVRERAARGMTTLAVTHDHVFAHEALDRGFVVQEGMVRDVGTLDRILDGIVLPAPAALMAARAIGLTSGNNRNQAVAMSIAERLRG